MPQRGIDGLPIVDAKHPVSIEITKDHIKRASRKEPGRCAIALACQDKLHALEVRIHLSRAFIRFNKGNWNRYFVPAGLRAQIIAFDRGGGFDPGTWVLNPVPHTESKRHGKRMGGKDKPWSKRKNSKAKKRPYHVIQNVRTGPFA